MLHRHIRFCQSNFPARFLCNRSHFIPTLNQVPLGVRNISQSVQDTSREVYVQPHSSKRDSKQSGIALLTLSRPQSKNALGKLMITQFKECLDELQSSILAGETRVVILHSAVDRVFCAGADLKERKLMSQVETSMFVSSLRNTFTQLEALSAPTIAAIDGAALGGGLEMALCCDMRVASDSATLGLVETKLAIIPGAGGTQRLPRLIGSSKAKELIFTGRRLSAADALKYGIINYSCPVSTALDKSLELAYEILPQGPVALRMAKTAIDQGIAHDINSGLAVEQLCYAQVIPTEDRLEGLKAFQEKRTPIYKGK